MTVERTFPILSCANLAEAVTFYASGTVPIAGIPRLLRIRRKAGAGTGFSIVDPGGCWLRFYTQASPDAGEAADDPVESAARGWAA